VAIGAHFKYQCDRSASWTGDTHFSAKVNFYRIQYICLKAAVMNTIFAYITVAFGNGLRKKERVPSV